MKKSARRTSTRTPPDAPPARSRSKSISAAASPPSPRRRKKFRPSGNRCPGWRKKPSSTAAAWAGSMAMSRPKSRAPSRCSIGCLGTLEEYVQIEAPSAELAPAAEAATARRLDVPRRRCPRPAPARQQPRIPPPPAPAAPADPAPHRQAASGNRQSPQREARHVADGK